MAWKGRLAFKTYNPLKPVRWGLKTYCLCDSKTGYLHNMSPYTGESNNLDNTVTELLGDLSGKGYHLYMDNFYNQVERTEKLRSSGTHVCGTLRRHRGEPLVLNKISRKGQMKKEEVKMRHKDGIMVLYWRDKKIVRMVNTMHPHDTIQIQERKKGSGAAKSAKQKPVCVDQYNRFMNGVDRMDQMISYYPFMRRTLKWPVKFIFYMLQMTLHNAFILHQSQGGKTRTLREFHLDVIDRWTRLREEDDDDPEEEYVPAGKTKAPNMPRDWDAEEPTRLDVRFHGHTLVPIQAKNCWYHRLLNPEKGGDRKDRKRKSTQWMCQKCNVALCVECFFIWHTKRTLPAVKGREDGE